MKPNLKRLLFGSPRETCIPGSRFPNGTQSMVPIVDIQKGVVITEDGRYIKILEILPTNFYLKSSIEQMNMIHYLASYLKIAPPTLQILVCTQRADIDAYCEQMERFYNTETNEACKAMILEDAQLVNYLAAVEAVSRHFNLVFEYTGLSSDFEDIAKELADQAETAYQYLDYCGLEVLRHESYNEFLFKILYSAFHKKAAGNADCSGMFSQLGAVYASSEFAESDLTDEDKDGMVTVQDMLAPDKCDLSHKEYLMIDGMYHAYLYVSGYG